MNSETKSCQNCKQPFTIEPEDFAFYERIKVPPPTFCPKCRFQRRLAFINMFRLYRRRCDLCGEDKISLYRPDAPYKVYCPDCWWSDKWDPLDYGRDYDFSRPFFEQLKELWREVPLLGLSVDLDTAKSSPHNNDAGHLKNCYMLFHADSSEDCAYGFYVFTAKLCLDSSLVTTCSELYDSMHAYKCSRSAGLRSRVVESLDCIFLKDSRNCQNCFASANLHNKKYYIFNKPYSKEEYFKELKKHDLGSYAVYEKVRRLAEEHWKTLPPKSDFNEFARDCTGPHIFQSKNCKECMEVVGVEDSKYMSMIWENTRDCYDITSWGNNLSLSYESSVVGENTSRAFFCQESGITLFDAQYSKLSTGGSHHFGCVSMKKGQYLILNKQYDKEDFEKMRAKIIEHMNAVPYIDKRGRVYRYGEFFPIELSPFAYNETIAQNFFPLAPDAAAEEGYKWAREEAKNYQITKTAADLPDHIKDVSDGILEEVIGCASCSKGFKVIKMELDLLRKMNLPLPRRCPLCRVEEKFNSWIKNLSLVPRKCGSCGAEMQSKYTKDEAPKVLCGKCYRAEVV